MTTHNAANERIKRKYLVYLREAMQNSEATLDTVAKSLHRFERHTKFRDFQQFHLEQAIAFKRQLAEQKSTRLGKPLSKATLYAVAADLKRFFRWLSRENGYRSRINFSDAEYFNISDKDGRVATAHRVQEAPSLEQIIRTIELMPLDSDIELRNRALFAFTMSCRRSLASASETSGKMPTDKDFSLPSSQYRIRQYFRPSE